MWNVKAASQADADSPRQTVQVSYAAASAEFAPGHRRIRAFWLLILSLPVLTPIVTCFISSLQGVGPQAMIDSTRVNLHLVRCALELYREHIGHFPAEAEGALQALVTRPPQVDPSRWSGPYLRPGVLPLTDAWGRGVRYRGPDAATPDACELLSAGPDGIWGTRDDIVDSISGAPTSRPCLPHEGPERSLAVAEPPSVRRRRRRRDGISDTADDIINWSR